MDAIAISDLHLGSNVCQVKILEEFLKSIHQNHITVKQLILNGDVFDSWDFRRLKKHHWHVLSLLRKLSNDISVIWVGGNHDGPADLISHLLGVTVANEHLLESGGKKILFHHGHRYDSFIDNHPILTSVADFCYWILQKIDPSFGLARSAKHASKTFLRNSEVIEKKSVERARRKGYDVVCCGHTHYPLAKPGPVAYYNSGSWTEIPCTYLAVADGQVNLFSYP